MWFIQTSQISLVKLDALMTDIKKFMLSVTMNTGMYKYDFLV